MSKEDNGGSAFPSHPDKWDKALNLSKDGMSLRDYFAAHSQAICPFNAYEHEKSAEWCYARADAMIKERKK